MDQRKRGPYKRYHCPRTDDEQDEEAVPTKYSVLPRTTKWRTTKELSARRGTDDNTDSLPTFVNDTEIMGFEALPTESDVELPAESDQELPSESDFSTHTKNAGDGIVTDIHNILSDSSGESDHETDLSVGSNELPTRNQKDIHFKELKDKLIKGYGSRIEKTIAVSPGEVLVSALTVAEKHNFNNQELLDVLNLVNTMFRKPILPDSQYLMDSLVFEDRSFTRHFFCQNCLYAFDQFDYKEVKEVTCDSCSAVNDVSDLCNASYFVTVDLAEQIELLFNSDVGEHYVDVNRVFFNKFLDIYDGKVYRDFVEKVKKLPGKRITFSFCVDGSPLYKSSNTEIWPITVIINELPINVRMRHVLLAGLWFGSSKPSMDLFLGPFAANMKKLEEEGFTLTVKGDEKKVNAHLLCCCVDSGARGSVMGISQHNGEYGCSWCLAPGVQLGHARKYPGYEVTKYSMRSKTEIIGDAEKLLQAKENKVRVGGKPVEHIMGVRSVSPLITVPSFDIVEGMSVESMHSVSLGSGRHVTRSMLEDSTGDQYIGDPNKRVILEDRISKLTLPKEARRLPRSLSDFANMKARDLENWILFESIPVLTGILDDTYLIHWSHLVEAFHILLSVCISTEQVTVANDLLKSFVRGIEELYGPQHMTYNVHLLLHLASNVERLGPLFASSGYCFEASNGFLKNQINANRGIANQICRSLSHSNALMVIKNAISLSSQTQNFIDTVKNPKSKPSRIEDDVAFYGSHAKFVPTEEKNEAFNRIGEISEGLLEFRKSKVNHCIVQTKYKTNCRTRNEFAKLKDGTSFKILKILLNENTRKAFIVGHVVDTKPAVPQTCPQLAERNALAVRLITRVRDNITIVRAGDLKMIECYSQVKVLASDFQPQKVWDYLISVPNIFNTV